MATPGDTHPGEIAVVGATGRQGSAVVRHLLRDRWRVRALTRDPARTPARALRQAGADVREADTEDPGALRRALDGVHGVYNVQNPMTSSIEAEIRQGAHVAAAVAAVGVAHVVYGAAGVGDEPTGVGSWDSKLVVAGHFREHGVPLTVLRPMAFMELMTDKGYYPAVSVWSVMPRLMGADRPVGWLCTDDLGAIAARVFAEPDRWVGRSLQLVADVRTVDECRDIWRRARGRPPRGFPMPVRLFERFVGTDLTTMWRWLRDAELDLSVEQTRALLPQARTVPAWVAEVSRG